jgi:hypothetical protein
VPVVPGPDIVRTHGMGFTGRPPELACWCGHWPTSCQ